MPLEEPRMARLKQTSDMGSVTRAWMSFSMTLGLGLPVRDHVPPTMAGSAETRQA